MSFLALLFFPLVKPFARLLVRLSTGARRHGPMHRNRFILDWAARETPSIALAGAARRGAAHGRCVRGPCCAVRSIRSIVGDRKSASRKTARMDNVLDRLDTAIKEYLTSLDTDALDEMGSPASVRNPGIHNQTSSMPATSSRRA